ncbi:uncharacterized protein TRIADDRAFT_59957 [Trichoplax adhaerens]|uniref:Arrestin C-terminal-like domain-containing protein n=1 Tax=Trichoplax adhaerens TaxID=10228 RepID=B3S6W8_TRIAD|nr:hypothetical protein TRIADDRAFT_59957 [Trichoplax adhaerens]EDV21465.1 hypothetical protein TRIADDRAFT_59957 [Trichoplax adhaerens]|eukprot:XP_002116065.1 hypothetical protein TRIADDRAFT_59957 [Trichoplax adhaerens]
MVKAIKVDININKDPALFLPGESVAGNVIVTPLAPVRVCGIHICILGEGSTYIKLRGDEINSNVGNSRNQRSCPEKEIYLDQEIIAWGSDNRTSLRESPILQTGDHTFDFSFELPNNIKIPSSFVFGENCKISYKVFARVVLPEKPEEVKDIKIIVIEPVDVTQPELSDGSNLYRYSKLNIARNNEHQFSGDHALYNSVISDIDLEHYGIKQESKSTLNQSTICDPLWFRTLVKLTAKIDHTGYCPGDNIILNVLCENMSNWVLPEITAILIRFIRWKAKNFTREKEVICSTFKSPHVTNRQRRYKWENYKLKIKAMPPSITSADIINVTYRLKIAVKVPCYNGEIEVSVPFVIGTLPLHSENRSQSTEIFSQLPISAPPDSRELPSYDDLMTNDQGIIVDRSDVQVEMNTTEITLEPTDD